MSAARRHVILTGAGGGIGTAMVQDLLDRDYSITALDVSDAALEQLRAAHVGDERLRTHVAELADSGAVNAAVDAAVEAFGTPYGLLNVAGNNKLGPLESITDSDWRFMFDTNLTSTFYLCRAVMPRMREQGFGRVVNTASIFGLRGQPDDAGYSAAKAGVVGLTRALAAEFAPANITVNCVAPVVVLTERVKRMPVEHLEKQRVGIPLGRFSTTQDVTRTFMFLLSDDGGFFTGQTLSPNGGDVMP